MYTFLPYYLLTKFVFLNEFLLYGIEMYGFENWNEVAEYVGTKTKSQCIDHYNAVYMNSPCFPLPVRLFENYVIN